jgi:hypothetical protein
MAGRAPSQWTMAHEAVAGRAHHTRRTVASLVAVDTRPSGLWMIQPPTEGGTVGNVRFGALNKNAARFNDRGRWLPSPGFLSRVPWQS